FLSFSLKILAMCVGKCSRIVGPCLLALGTLSVLASILLLFPGGASRYLLQGHLGRHARALPGLWGGGIAVSTAGTTLSQLCLSPLSVCVPPQALLSVLLSKLALLGSAACFVLCGVGLSTGPLCLHNSTALGPGHNYLYNRSAWSTCLEPEGIVAWHVGLFSLLLLVSAAEMLLALLQILNGLLGCLCGSCEGK
uniref:T4S1 protein n=1 Tax=Junco hyemalis TaxID=40217 RepID=A0A8C5JNN5_JUNHY